MAALCTAQAAALAAMVARYCEVPALVVSRPSLEDTYLSLISPHIAVTEEVLA